MRNIVIEKTDALPIENQEIEIIERKCSGHPDTICDAIGEAVSRELSKEYIKKFGHVLHHNVDKALLVAGASEPKFLGGKIKQKIKIIICGRATAKAGSKKIDVKGIAVKAAKNYLKNLHALKEKDYEIKIEINEGAGYLKEVFADKIPLSNDTSFGVGYAPFSRTERIVLEASKMLVSPEFIEKYPAVGEDIKVMALRQGRHVKLTVCIAFIDKYVKSLSDYYDIKEKVAEEIRKISGCSDVTINTLDKPRDKAKTINDIYLTVTGLSAEMGDDGQIGRGNRVNGLITPNRVMTLEAAAGKNPTRHTGKIYSVLANIIASEIVKKTSIKEVSVKILSRIGKPIDEPQVVSIQTPYELGNPETGSIRSITEHWFGKIQDVTKLIIDGKVGIY